jgi:chromosome segregation ATPase
MVWFMSRALQKRLITYGIIPSLCITAWGSSTLYADEKKSLVILEGRQQGKIPEGSNLQQKVQVLTALTREQAERIQALQEEMQALKNKLHIIQLTQFSGETGNYKQLYSNLKQESARNKETHLQLEKTLQQLQTERDSEKQKTGEMENQMISLKSALESQALALEKIEEKYKEELNQLYSSKDERASQGLKIGEMENQLVTLMTALESQTLALEKIEEKYQQELDHLSSAKWESEKGEAENQMVALMTALESQTLALEKIEENYKQELEHLSSSKSESENYQQIHATLENELKQQKETQSQLENLIQQLREESENEKLAVDKAESHISALTQTLKEQMLAFEIIEENYKKQIEQLSSLADETQNYRQKASALEEELAHSQKSREKVEFLLTELKEAHETDLRELSESDAHMSALIEFLDVQNLPLDISDEMIETLTLEPNQQELAKAKETQGKLEQHIQQLKSKNESDQQKRKEAEAHARALYETWQTEFAISEIITNELFQHYDNLSSQSHEDAETLNNLADALDFSHFQFASAMHSEIDKDEKLQDLIGSLDEEQLKTAAIQKNLDEVQQIYDQTVKLYNELYADHKTAQKQMDLLQQELDERKMNHLVEIDNLEIKMENLASELKKEQIQVQQLQEQLSNALAETEHFQPLKDDHLQLSQESDDIKNAYIHHLDTLSLHEDLLSQATHELEHQKKVIDDQSVILQQVYQDKQAIAAQLQAIPFAPEEIAQLQEKHVDLLLELQEIKAAHLQHLHADALYEDLVSNAHTELETQKTASTENKDIIQQLMQEKEFQKAAIEEKNTEINRLNEQIAQIEDQIKDQFREFAMSLESEKCKNFELQKELTEHNQLYHSKEQHVHEIREQLESLKDDLALKDQSYALQKIEMEDLNDRLKEIHAEKSKLMLQMQMIEEKHGPINLSSDEQSVSFTDSLQEMRDILANKEELLKSKETDEKLAFEERLKMEDSIKKLQTEKEGLYQQITLLQPENQKLHEELNSLKQQLENNKQSTDQQEAKISAIQKERLQEALQQMIIEKTALQSNYQNQMINEKILSQKLEEALAELERYKAEETEQ